MPTQSLQRLQLRAIYFQINVALLFLLLLVLTFKEFTRAFFEKF